MDVCWQVLQGIFLIQGSNWGLLHYRQILYCLSHQGSLLCVYWMDLLLTLLSLVDALGQPSQVPLLISTLSASPSSIYPVTPFGYLVFLLLLREYIEVIWKHSIKPLPLHIYWHPPSQSLSILWVEGCSPSNLILRNPSQVALQLFSPSWMFNCFSVSFLSSQHTNRLMTCSWPWF